MSDPSSSMLHNATIGNAERNEISNSARDNIRVVQNNFNVNMQGESGVPESHDAMGYLLTVVPPFLAEVRKSDHSRSTVSETTGADGSDPLCQTTSADQTPHSSIPEGDFVSISNIVPADPSSLPVTSIADRYTRSMLKCLAGYPLYEPQPFSDLSTEYLSHGIKVGDVGFVRWDGVFDFLFNICPSPNGFINPSKLPDGFFLETYKCSTTRAMRPLARATSLFQSPITRTKSGEYISEGSDGAVLELPEGAIQDEVVDMLPFENLAARHGVEWYKYTMSRGRAISNGSLYLITSSTKCTQWGIAVFDRPCTTGQGLRFDRKRSLPFRNSTSKYHWKGSRAFTTKVAVVDPNQGDAPNQCVFLRGYKIMIRQDIFDNLRKDQLRGSHTATPPSSPQAGTSSSSPTRHRAQRIRGGAGPDPGNRPLSRRLTSGSLVTRITKSNIHPSDLINAALLSQNPGAKVALTHDDVWCNLLHDNFPKLNFVTLINVAQSYTLSMVDKYGSISLEKISDPSNVLDESNHPDPVQGITIPALQEPIQGARDKCNPDISIPEQASITPQSPSVDHSHGSHGARVDTLMIMGKQALTYRDQGKWREAESLQVQVMEARKEMFGALHPDTLTAMHNLAATYSDQGKWMEAEGLQIQVMEASKEILGALHPNTLTAMANLATTKSDQGKWKESESLQVQVMEARKDIFGVHHPSTLTAMHNLAATYSDQGKWMEAESLQVQVMESSEEKLRTLHPDMLVAMGQLALTYRDQGRWIEAERLQVQVMEGSKEKLGVLHPDTLTAMHNLAATYSDQGKWMEAERLQVQVMEARKDKLGALHPNTLVTTGQLALTYKNQGKSMEAESLQFKVTEASIETLGALHPSTLTAMHNLAAIYSDQGKWMEAERLQVRVMEASKEILGALHPDTLITMGQLALTYRNHGKWTEAESLQAKVMEASKEKLGALHPSTLTAMHNLAATYSDQGKWMEAEILQIQVMKARKEILGLLHPDTLLTMHNLAATYSDQRKWDESERLQMNKIFQALHPSALTTVDNLTLTHSDQGNRMERGS